MKRLFLVVAILAAAPLLAQPPAPVYKIEFDPNRDVTLSDQNEAGVKGLFVKVRFSITIEGAAHGFNAEGNKRMVTAMVDWFDKQLGKGASK